MKHRFKSALAAFSKRAAAVATIARTANPRSAGMPDDPTIYLGESDVVACKRDAATIRTDVEARYLEPGDMLVVLYRMDGSIIATEVTEVTDELVRTDDPCGPWDYPIADFPRFDVIGPNLAKL
jgi:hypothetical protein